MVVLFQLVLAEIYIGGDPAYCSLKFASVRLSSESSRSGCMYVKLKAILYWFSSFTGFMISWIALFCA